MNNKDIEKLLDDTTAEFSTLEILIKQVGPLSPMCKYLSYYSLMKACGVIEYSYKAIVADYHKGCSLQLQSYLEKTVRDSSKNPSLDNMRKLLKSFDITWNNNFNNYLNNHPNHNQIKASIDSLNSNRNSFAHGQNCTITFGDVKQYYADAVEVIKCYDAAVV